MMTNDREHRIWLAAIQLRNQMTERKRMTDNIRMFLRKMSKWNLYEIVSAYGTHGEYVSVRGICAEKYTDRTDK